MNKHELNKFGPTVLLRRGMENDPYDSNIPPMQVPSYTCEGSNGIGEGRIPFSEWGNGVHIINTQASRKLRIRIENSELRVEALDRESNARFYAYIDKPYGRGKNILRLDVKNKGWEGDPQKKHPDIHPGVLFEEMMKYFEARGIHIDGILDKWTHDSDNYKMFIDAMGRGLSKEQAALQTWSYVECGKATPR